MLRVSRLRCEYLVDPVGIDVHRPRLSWELSSSYPDTRGARQTAYRIMATEDAGHAVAWDSGRVLSDRTAQVEYAGKPLSPCAAYRFKVRVWDENGGASEWSPEGRWTMGPWAEGWPLAWKGAEKLRFPPSCWIGPSLPDTWNERESQPSPCLRKTFTVDAPVRRAVLFASALGVYEARLNGRRVGDAVLSPEWTDYRKKVQYQGYDVTGMVREGENVIGAILGPGWYAGQLGLGRGSSGITRGYYGRLLRFAAFLLVETERGGSESPLVLVTDGSWKQTTDGPIRSSDILAGETYDARREMPGWDSPGYDDTSWQPVTLCQGPTLVAQPNEPIRITQDLAAVSVAEPIPGVYVFDMGQNMVGWVRMKVRGHAGAEIRIRHGEALTPEGRLYRDNLRLDPKDPRWGAQQEDRYICRGSGEEIFEPHFTYHGFRYVEVTELDHAPAAWDMVGRVLHSSSPEAGSFECGSSLLNRIMTAIQWTQRGNMHGIPTDCPQRDERLGWAGDLQVFSQTAMFNRDMAGFLTKWLRDMRDGQSDDGRFPSFAPIPFDPAGQFRGNPGWADAGVIVPWLMYENYGDLRALEEGFDAARRWVDYGARNWPDLLWREPERFVSLVYGDWLNADTFVELPGLPKTGGEVPKEIYCTAFFAHSAELVGRMAAALGMRKESGEYARLARRIRAAFNKAYVSKDGRIRGDTQAGYALTLAFDLLPAGLRSRAAKRMVSALKPYGGALSTGIQSTVRLMRELVRWGYAEESYRLLHRTDVPSWGYMVEHGGTTMWERWDGWVEGRGFQNPGMNSFNHYAIGSVGEWMWRVIAGINPDENAPGFANILINPVPGGGITRAKAVHRTIRGPVRVEWSRDRESFTLQVSIPPNTSASVIIPNASARSVMESDRPLAAAPGVRIVGRRRGGLVVAIRSGNYRFVAHAPGAGRAIRRKG